MPGLSAVAHSRPRSRLFYALALALVVVSGLLSRSEALGLPGVVAKYLGGALWAAMVFLGLGLLLPARSTAVVAAMACAVCGAVELSQLYHAPWIDDLRRTWLGRMTLGHSFAWGDLAAYLAGVGACAFLELAQHGRAGKSDPL